MKQILIGGAPSTGSSLLVRMLDRHPALFAGPETYLFIHPKLYDHWSRFKWCLVRRCLCRGLKSEGWFRFNGARLLLPEYGWLRQALRQQLDRAHSLSTFAKAFFAKAMERKGATIWVEKTPSNAMCFALFHAHFPNSRVIHTTRHPLDTIASLMGRGYEVAYATAAYLVNTALAMRTHTQHWQFTLRYEDLVHNPELTLDGLCTALGIPYLPLMLEPEGQGVRLAGWQHDASGVVRRGSVGRFQQLSQIEQALVMQAVAYLHIGPAFAKKWGIIWGDIPSIAAQLRYALPPLPPADRKLWQLLQRTLQRDRVQRVLRCYPTGWCYPVAWK